MKRSLALLMALLFIAQTFAVATLSVQGDESDSLSNATHIVTGTIERVSSRWNQERTMIYSYVTLSVEQYLKGVSHGRQITVKYQGGEVGDIAAFVSEEPVFTVGERVELFVKLEETGEFGVVGGKLGKISLTDIGVGEPASYGYSGIHWKAADIPVKYYINNLGTPDVPGTIEFYAVQASFDTWEIDPQSYLDYTYMGTTTRMEGYDGYNVVSWDYMDGPGGVLAHCVSWYMISTKELVEFDITFDEGDAWSVSGEAGKFDIQHVGTHEAGHTLVLNDLYNPAENKETMYGYTSTGQVSQRTLYTGDLAGLRYIYPIGTILTPDLMISIETDKPTYQVGDTMRLGIEVINHGSSRTVAAKVWVTLPTGATDTILEYPSFTVPSGFEYINMIWQTYTLPASSTGKNVWHATLKYTGSTVSEDIATYYATYQAVPPSVEIWTDKATYARGETMNVYVQGFNPGPATTVKVTATIGLPGGGTYGLWTIYNGPVPASYTGPETFWKSMQVPYSAAVGTYSWIAEIRNPTTNALIDSDTYYFTVT